MSYVLRIEKRVRGYRRDGISGSDPIGKYLVRFDRYAYGGQGAVLVSRFPLSAMKFETSRDAVAFWDDSGPLRAFLISVHEVEDEDE